MKIIFFLITFLSAGVANACGAPELLKTLKADLEFNTPVQVSELRITIGGDGEQDGTSTHLYSFKDLKSGGIFLGTAKVDHETCTAVGKSAIQRTIDENGKI